MGSERPARGKETISLRGVCEIGAEALDRIHAYPEAWCHAP